VPARPRPSRVLNYEPLTEKVPPLGSTSQATETHPQLTELAARHECLMTILTRWIDRRTLEPSITTDDTEARDGAYGGEAAANLEQRRWKMTESTLANADGIEAAQARICEVRAIMQLVVENLERIPAASHATDALHVANEMLDGVYEQLESLLKLAPDYNVMPFVRSSARRDPAP